MVRYRWGHNYIIRYRWGPETIRSLSVYNATITRDPYGHRSGLMIHLLCGVVAVVVEERAACMRVRVDVWRRGGGKARELGERAASSGAGEGTERDQVLACHINDRT